MAEIDPRFRTYYIADEVICENLTARKVESFSYGFIMIGFPIPKSSNIIFHSSALFWMAFTQLS